VIVDHGLQEGSPAVAGRGADQCRHLGLDPVEVVTVKVASSGPGPEARARDARYRAFEVVAQRVGAVAVLLGHTRDDQAEQVLLGLARGSGARSLSGMPARRGPYLRPLLGVARAATAAACEAAGLTAWVDPQNSDPAYGRVRARALLPVLEAELGRGTVAALARGGLTPRLIPTTGPNQAGDLARRSVVQGADLVLILGGDSALVLSAVAVALCLVPTTLTLMWADWAYSQSPEQQLTMVLGATGVRMGIVLGVGLLLYTLVPFFEQQSFWLWLLAFYLLSLALERVLVVKGKTATESRQEPISARSDS
jgi:tRNA(Ile)-lysidine synthetase-like protein